MTANTTAKHRPIGSGKCERRGAKTMNSSTSRMEHAGLVRAIESGRPATAEAAIREHLETATVWLVDRVAEPKRLS
jgi:DNA-binding FadR family transcriptional regulator